MKVVEINNKEGTYVYDEEYGSFLDVDTWEELNPNCLSREFEIPKEGEILILKQEERSKLSVGQIKGLKENDRGEYTAVFSKLDADGDFVFNGIYYNITWFELRPKSEHTTSIQDTSKEDSSIPLSRKKLLLTKYFK